MKALTLLLTLTLVALAMPYDAMASSASSEVHTVITANGGGTSVVDIQTSTNGKVNTEHIVSNILSDGTVEFNYATTSNSGSSIGAKGNSQAHVGVTMHVGGNATTSKENAHMSGLGTTTVFKGLPGLGARFHQSFSNLSNILGSIFSWFTW